MSSVAREVVRVIGGVDTHKDMHVAAAVDELGRQLGHEQFPATGHGYADLAAWLASFGEVLAVGVEGTGAWGAGLARHLESVGITVVEVRRPNRQRRRWRGKSDPIDAQEAARAVLVGEAAGAPKTATGTVECIRLLRLARRSAIKARTQALNIFDSTLVGAPDTVRDALRGLRRRDAIVRAARFRPGTPATPERAARFTLATIARRVQALDAEVAALDTELAALVASAAPTLLALPGVGPETAGTLLVAAGDNPHRLRDDAAFAALCGASPVQASSGKVVRHRLNRGGDRDANSALWRIVLVRMGTDPRTRAYVARRTAEGRSKAEIMRALKRYVARQTYRAIIDDAIGVAPPMSGATCAMRRRDAGPAHRESASWTHDPNQSVVAG
jgi:transposase